MARAAVYFYAEDALLCFYMRFLRYFAEGRKDAIMLMRVRNVRQRVAAAK